MHPENQRPRRDHEPSKAPVPSELWRAYRETHYHVRSDPPFVLRVDEESRELRALHAECGVAASAFVTAFNPGSAPCSDEANGRRHAELLAEVERLALAVRAGAGQHPTNGWPPEESLLVLGIDEASAAELGRRFGQNAVLWAGADATPRLLDLLSA